MARQIYDETDDHGRHRYTVAQIAAELGVTRPTIYRYLDQLGEPPKTSTR
jgi:AcrR family transcriptional regulator